MPHKKMLKAWLEKGRHSRRARLEPATSLTIWNLDRFRHLAAGLTKAFRYKKGQFQCLAAIEARVAMCVIAA